VLVGWQFVVTAVQAFAWSTVAFDLTLDDGVNVQVGVPEMAAVPLVPASVIVTVHGAELERTTCELPDDAFAEIVAPVSVSLPIEYASAALVQAPVVSPRTITPDVQSHTRMFAVPTFVLWLKVILIVSALSM